MKSPWCGSATLNSVSNVFAGVQGGCVFNTTESSSYQICSTGGTVSNLYVKLATAPSAAHSRVFTLRVNGVNSALTCTVSDTNTTANDTSHSVTVAAGDILTLGVTSTAGSTNAGRTEYAMMFTGSTAKESVITGNRDGSDTLGAGPDGAVAMGGNGKTPDTTGFQVMPTSGALKNLYVNLVTAPGVGTSRTCTLYVNGVASALTCTVSGTNTTANDTTHSVTIAAGDKVLIVWTASGAAAASAECHGMKFVADTDGESVCMARLTSALSNTATNFINIPANNVLGSSEASNLSIDETCVVKKFYVVLASAPGASKSFTFDVRVNSASPANTPTVAISGASTTGNDTTNTATLSAGDTFDVRSVPAGTPTIGTENGMGFVFFISTAVANGNFFMFM